MQRKVKVVIQVQHNLVERILPRLAQLGQGVGKPENDLSVAGAPERLQHRVGVIPEQLAVPRGGPFILLPVGRGLVSL